MKKLTLFALLLFMSIGGLAQSKVYLTKCITPEAYVKKIIFTFYTSAKKHPSDAFIRQTDKAIRAIKFPPTTNYGINSNSIYMPIKKNELQQYLE